MLRIPISRSVVIALASVACAATQAATPTSAHAKPALRLEVGVERVHVDADGVALIVRRGTGRDSLIVEGTDLQRYVQRMKRGRVVYVDYGGTPERPIADRVLVPFGRWARFWTLLLVWLLFSFVWWLFGRLSGRDWLVGQDNRFSNSKCQMALWFGLLMIAYVSALVLRWRAGGAQLFGWVGIPENLLVLSGISVLTFGGAKGITQAKVDRAASAGGATKTRAAQPQLLQDLLSDDQGHGDLGDFQMLVVTLLAMVVWFVQVFVFLGTIELARGVMLPDVDSTILAVFGLGQAAYLGKKLASRLGEG